MAAVLSGDRIERLAELLESRAVPFKGMNLEALDGFLSAIALSPEPVPMEEWVPAVWGGKAPRWADADEAREVQALLEAHLALATRRVCHEGDELPDHLAPLLWLPEDPEAPQSDELDLGSDWAGGFLEAVALREAAWDAWFTAEPWIDEIAMLLDQLATGDILAEDPTQPSTPLAYRERVDIVLSLPGMLADLQHHRIDALTPRTPLRREATPERNAPCPCGSGRKYKKCCGA